MEYKIDKHYCEGYKEAKANAILSTRFIIIICKTTEKFWTTVVFKYFLCNKMGMFDFHLVCKKQRELLKDQSELLSNRTNHS